MYKGKTEINKITVFNAKKTQLKHPLSPYDDNTFIFETYESRTNSQMFEILVSHFVLNIPLSKLDTPIRTFRRKVNLDKLYSDNLTYFILDIDNVKNKANKNVILDFFKDYKVIIGESKSYNGIDNFNMKGILFTENILFSNAKIAISEIHHSLKEYCVIDECVIRKVSLNAPILKNEVFINNENGKLYSFSLPDARSVIKNEYIDTPKLDGVVGDSIEKICLSTFKLMGFTAVKNNDNDSITFKHPSEKKSIGGYFWFESSPYTMHHANSVKTVNIFDTVRKLDIAKALMVKDINYNDEFQQFNTDTNVINVNEKYLKITTEIDDTIGTFLADKNGLFSIRSPMGTGKSTIIGHIINESHQLDMRVLIITNRISVATDFGKKYDMKVYNKDKYILGDSLICQFDSLWRYNLKFFDIIIMDEFISLMTHSRSNLNKSSLNIAKFFASFKKKLVIADAFLTGYENFLLESKQSNLHLVDNSYRDSSILYDYTDSNYFVQNLLLHAQKNKITVSATSLSFIHALDKLLTGKGLSVVTLTAETPVSTKELIYSLFEVESHDKWDVLIYSPTLTVGVSNLNNCPYHFHYDSSMSADVISSIQMVKRTRKSKEIHMFIKPRIKYLKTTYNSIRDEYMGNIGKNIGHNYLFSIDDYGETKLSNIGKKAIKIDTFKNILEFNHKEAVMWMMKYHFQNDARVIDKKFTGNILSKYQRENRKDKKNSVRSNITQFLKLNDIEKTSILLDSSVDKTLRTLAEIDEHIIDCDNDIKIRIIENSLKDNEFIKKCIRYNIVFNYTKKIWDITDIKHRVSESIINGETDDLNFFNLLIKYGQKEIHDDYLPKIVSTDKLLKAILDRCGYSITKQNAPGVIGHRGYIINSEVKSLFKYMC